MGGGGLAFPGRRVTGSGALGQSADRQAPDAISGGARLSSQFPFFPPSETRNAEPVHVTSPQPQAGVLGLGEARLLSSTQEACIEVGKGRRRTGTFHPALLLNRPWKHWRRPFHTLEKDLVVIGHRVQDKIHNLPKSLALPTPL